MHAVEAQQVRIGFDRREIVDGDDFDVGALGLGDGAQDIAADAAEPIDGNADRHCSRSRLIQPVMAAIGHDAY